MPGGVTVHRPSNANSVSRWISRSRFAPTLSVLHAM
jgi:hypothetical protein